MNEPVLPGVALRRRIASIDALRGLVLAIMALDHVRDFFHVGAMSFQPDDLARTDPVLFMTRWITHLCAPAFMLTAGLGAYLWRGQGRDRTAGQLSRFLWTRGLWLVVLDLVVVRFAMFASLTSAPVLLTVLWVLGWSMVLLAALIHLHPRVLLVLSVAVIALHNLTDRVTAADLGSAGWLWNILHQPGAFLVSGVVVFVGYPLVPWVAVMALGYCLGPLFTAAHGVRRRTLVTAGAAMIAAFVALRLLNIYGDPQPFDAAVSPVLSFFRTTKYPPSLQFLLMTLGPVFLLLAWFDSRIQRNDHPLLIVGRVPLFFFLGHFLLIRLLTYPAAALTYGDVSFLRYPLPSMGGPADQYPAAFGYPLWVVYLLWLLVLALMYPACRWFAAVRARRRDWWLKYL